MSTKRFTYNGPLSAATIDGEHVGLAPGAELELDDASDYVRTLIARGWLSPAKTKQLPASKAEGSKTNSPNSAESTDKTTSGAEPPKSKRS
jgi:hypothetical protein